MTLWPRVFCAIVCWFLLILVVLVTANHYLPLLTDAPSGLGQKLLFVMGMAATAIVVGVATLYFWFWVWARKYW